MRMAHARMYLGRSPLSMIKGIRVLVFFIGFGF
jgi:hypothetical protein